AVSQAVAEPVLPPTLLLLVLAGPVPPEEAFHVVVDFAFPLRPPPPLPDTSPEAPEVSTRAMPPVPPPPNASPVLPVEPVTAPVSPDVPVTVAPLAFPLI